MDAGELAETVRTQRRIGFESERVEVKSGRGGFPVSAVDTMVAFANGDGGTILIGIDEQADFAAVQLDGANRYRDKAAQLARDAVEPALQVSTDLIPFGDATILAIEVPPLNSQLRPAYVRSKGMATGAYIRSGDGERRLTQSEIALLVAARSQPEYDKEAVPGTSLEDVDEDALRRTLQRVRAGSSSLSRVDDITALRRIQVLAQPRADSPLTLAGLLTFGDFPQSEFPQLMISVVAHAPEPSAGTRFLDNVTLRGNIPTMVTDALGLLRRNLAARAIMSPTGREDRLEYPLLAIREALINAVMHRDYSPVTRGTQVQVDLYSDRLDIRSPGGIYGPIAIEELGEEGVSSSRNAVLASLLSDTFLPGSNELVAENRASGVPAMIGLARDNGLPRPIFRSSVSSFVVTMNRSQLLDPATRRWIADLKLDGVTSAHEVALAMMRTAPVTNAMLREWGIDRLTATQVLRDLVDQGVAIKEGGRRYAEYQLDPGAVSPPEEEEDPFAGLLPTVAGVLQERGEASAAQLSDATGVSRRTVLNRLDALMADGKVEAVGSGRSPKRRYRWIASSEVGKE